MAVLLVALGLFIHLRFTSQLDKTIDEGLKTHADDVGTLLAEDRSALAKRPQRALDDEERFAEILTPDGKIVARTTHAAHPPLFSRADLARASARPTYFKRTGVPVFEGPARLLLQPFDLRGRRLLVLVGASLDDRNAAVDNLRTLTLIGGAVALLLASLAGYGMVAASLRPVEAMRRRAAAISAAEPDQRLPVPPADDELARLGDTLNEMIARLEAALEKERTFVDDASHELRTPLALLRTELEVALKYERSPEQLRAAMSSVIEEVDRLVQLAADLLVLARSGKGRLDIKQQPVAIDELLETVRERFAARAASAGRALVVQPPPGRPVYVEGDQPRLEQALTNLVDNAMRHGAGEIRLSAREHEDRVELHVEDEGPGFTPGFIERAFERFSRADSARGSGGTGLGLAIVEAIARAHDGWARAANRPDGGADVWLDLPARGSRTDPSRAK
jgi:two-component system, OmpR family, sensor kinase